MKNKILKISLCTVLLVVLVMLFSSLPFANKSYLELISSKFFIVLYIFAGHNIITSLVPGILAIGYAFALFSILKNDPRQQIIMVINAVILIILSLTIGIIIVEYTNWTHLYIIITFTKAMTVIGLLNILLSFTFKLFKDKKLE